MKTSLVFGACVVAVASMGPDPQWEQYKKQFHKRYASPKEEEERHEIFHESLKRINELNRHNGEAVFGLTVTSDRKQEEKFKRGAKKPSTVQHENVLDTPKVRLPSAIDWRLTPAVTAVKNQGQCGSCWAFSVAETVESTYILSTGSKYEVTLSPQQIASCTTTCDGCGGGWTADAYEYLKSVPGLASAWYWPYAQGLIPSQSCDSTTCTQACSSHNASLLTPDEFYIGNYAAVSGYKYATPHCTDACENQDLEKLAASLEQGPVSVCVNAASWDDYVGGVLTEKACGGKSYNDLDHCVQLVGFNSTAENPYWIVRNSWDTVWGMDGYIHLAFETNTCGLADQATVPTISNVQDTPELKDAREKMFSVATRSSNMPIVV